MCAMASERLRLARRTVALLACAQLGLAPQVLAGTPANKPSAVKPATERQLIQVLVPLAPLHEKPDADSPVIGQVEQGTQLEADARVGEWYRVLRSGAEPAWILNAQTPT